MKATIPYIEQKFEEFNQLCFAGRLPKLSIELSDAKTFLGVCVYKKRKNKEGKTEYYDFRLRINTRIDLPEQEVEDTIIHEMIHYFIGVNNLEDTSAHGPVFQHLMNTINEKYGRNITISHKGSAEENEQAYDTKQHWHVVAVVSFKNGKIGIKVLPRVIQQILKYYNGVIKARGVVGIKLYMSNDIYFNRFPNSAALNVQYVEPDDLEEHLKDAEVVECNGKEIITGGKSVQPREPKVEKPHWHVIAVLSLADGTTGVKVLPRVLPRILTFYNEMNKWDIVEHIDLYMSNNVFFNKYPNSGTLTYHSIERSTLMAELKGTEVMKCDGKRVIRQK